MKWRYLEYVKCMFGQAGVTYLPWWQFEYGASWERPNLLPIWEAQVCSFHSFSMNAPLIVVRPHFSSEISSMVPKSSSILSFRLLKVGFVSIWKLVPQISI